MVRQRLQTLQARKQRECAVRRVIDKFGPADIADHQRVAGQHEPGLVRSRTVGREEADMLGRVAGRMHHMTTTLPSGSPSPSFTARNGKPTSARAWRTYSASASAARARPAER